MIEETLEQAAERLGHVLRRDDDGDIDIFVMDFGYHNGHGCINCGQSWCHHCDGPEKIDPCIGKEAADQRDKEARRKQYETLRAEFGGDVA